MESSSQAPSPEALEQALAHIEHYCMQCWHGAHLPDDVCSDATQDVVLGLYEAHVLPGGAQELFVRDHSASSPYKVFIRIIWRIKKKYQRADVRRQRHSELTEHDARVPAHYDAPEAEDRDVMQRILVAVESLSAKSAEVMRLILSGIDSPTEIANILGTRPERVSDMRYRSIQQLRAMLAGTV